MISKSEMERFSNDIKINLQFNDNIWLMKFFDIYDYAEAVWMINFTFIFTT